MRTLRQRYTRWFNLARGTAGALWAERLCSVLVQDTPLLVGRNAAYIDLNAVRAGLTDLPENCRWCGYTEALAGGISLPCPCRLFPGGGGNEGGACVLPSADVRKGSRGGGTGGIPCP